MNLKKLKLISISILFYAFNTHAEDLAYCKEGWANVNSGKYDEAFDIFEKCISEGNLTTSTLALMYRNQGLALNDSGQYKLAIESFDKALSLEPDDPWVDYVNRGNSLSGLERYKDALFQYELALKAKPNYNQAYFNRGILYERIKKTDFAIKEYEKAYEYGLRSKHLISRLEKHGLARSKYTTNSSIDKTLIKLEDVKNISSVFKMENQICSSQGAMTHLTKFHDSEIIKSSKQIKLDDLKVTFKIPQIGKQDDTIIKLYLKDKSRGVIDHYVYFSKGATDIQHAALVFTELPEGTKRKSAFRSMEITQNALSSKSGAIVKLKALDGPHGESLELIVPNRIGSICYPTSTYSFSENSKGISTIGISRFSFIKNIIIEFAIIVEIPNDINDAEAVSYAQRLMNGFWTRLIIDKN